MQRSQHQPRSGRAAFFAIAALGATIAAVLAAMFAHGSSAASSNPPQPPRTPEQAVAIAVQSLPAGSQAVAAVGSTKIYASTTGGTSCLSTVQASGVAGNTCGPTAHQQAHGLLSISITPGSPVTIAVLPPSGASGVEVTDKDGTHKPVAISNGAAAVQDANPAAVTYVMQNGTTQTEEIPAHILEERAPPPPDAETH